MYYKITNKKSKLYKDLYNLRASEVEKEVTNKELVKQKVELEFENFLGQSGQQNFWRVTQYNGFLFKEPDKVNPQIWSKHKQYPQASVPNKKTKLGKEMYNFLNDGVEKGNLYDLLEILDCSPVGKFAFPYLHIANENTLILYVDDKFEPKDKNFIEITSKEFKELNK